MHKPNPKPTSGFTTIEIVVAIVLFAILVPTIISFINSIASLNDHAKDVSIINSVIENKIESVRSSGYRSVSPGTTNFTNELPATISSPRSAIMTVSDLEPNIKEIKIIVTYTARGNPSAVEYVTYIGEIGVGQY